MSLPAHPPTPRLFWVPVICLLLAMAVIITAAQWQMSPTYDEQNHVTRGISVLRTGDYRLCFHHPPLANVLEALPVAWRGDHGFSMQMPAWTSLGIWQAARTTIWSTAADGLYHGAEIIRLARLPVLLLTLGLGLIIFLWARELFGVWGGLLSLSLFALDPTMLAHGGLATTDMAAACTILLAVFLLRRYVRQPTHGSLRWAGIGMGLALTAKFSALILIPITGLLLLVLAIWPTLQPEGLPAAWINHSLLQRIGKAVGVCLFLGVLAGVVVWGIYGFHVEARGAKPGQPLSAHASWSRRIPIPAMQYFRGLKTVKSEEKGHPVYLLGVTRTSGRGWWYYFPVTMAVKTPLPELFLLCGALLLFALPRTRARLAVPGIELLWLLAPVGIYTLAALGFLGVSLNLGIRHVMPLFPFLMILAGAWADPRLWAASFARSAVLAVSLLLVCQLASVGQVFPNFLAYFNEAAGGVRDGARCLIDSNLDWGQDLERLAAQQHADRLPFLMVSYFGTTPLEAVGLDALPAPGFGATRTAPRVDLLHYQGYLAISKTNLYGGPGYSGEDYTALLRVTPYERVGETMLIYQLPIPKVQR